MIPKSKHFSYRNGFSKFPRIPKGNALNLKTSETRIFWDHCVKPQKVQNVEKEVYVEKLKLRGKKLSNVLKPSKAK